MVKALRESSSKPHIYRDLSIEALVERATANKEGEIADNGALVVKTGARTGRSPKDKFIVKDAQTEKKIAWNDLNQSITTEQFNALWQKASNYLEKKSEYYVSKLRVGAHPKYGINVRVTTELAWHQLFCSVLFIRDTDDHTPATWELRCIPGMKSDPKEDGVHSDAAILLNFSDKKILICGTYYAGEMKKSMFSVLNFLLPDLNILPMHCAANQGRDGETALFFGLSGTGKTTLSADPERLLIGDDEHGWAEDIVFNFEGGCYAKCINLSQQSEPLIWNALRKGCVIENVILDPTTKKIDFTDSSITENTRAAYPRDYIEERVQENFGSKPKVVIFLTCDLYGVLPPVATLSIEQAAYYFLSGYTALVGSTEVGGDKAIKPTFSSCFGAPFFSRPPILYAKLLMQKLREDGATVYLVNTGYTGGSFKTNGKRFSIPTTRSIIHAILDNKISDKDCDILPGFQLKIPKKIAGIDDALLNPRNTWADKGLYDEHAKELIEKFIENFKKFAIDGDIISAGPKL